MFYVEKYAMTILLLILTTALGIAIANLVGGMLVVGAILGFCAGAAIRWGVTGDIDF
jgi:hypothetical protein